MGPQGDKFPLLARKIKQHELIHLHFDPDFYINEYDELGIKAASAFDHFVERGWLESRNPNSFTDTWKVLSQQAKETHTTDDLMHLLGESAVAATRQKTNTFSPGDTILNYKQGTRDTLYAIVRLVIDQAYYKTKFFPNIRGKVSNLNLGHHFIAGACREGHRPYKDAIQAIEKLEQAELLKLSIWIQQASEFTENYVQLHAFIDELRDSIEAIRSMQTTDGALKTTELNDDQKFVLSKISENMDADFYLKTYPEIKIADVDPAFHYTFTGWKEGKNPTPAFETDYYLRSNTDIREAAVNPFYHFIVAGQTEGRLPKRPGSAKRKLIEDQIPVRNRSYGGPDVSSERKLSVHMLANILSATTKGAKGIVLSVSHDCYIRSIGGTQIFIGDEAAGFARAGYKYVHISPTKFDPYLVQRGADYLVQVVLDNKYLGIISITRFREAIRAAELPSLRPAAMIHVMLGHDPDALVDLLAAFKAQKTYLWLHDYSTICTGFNLLRNGVEFCGGPKVTSMACRICIHGAERSEHIKRVRDFFASVKPVAVAPSDRAAELWWRMRVVECETVLIIPHVELVPAEVQLNHRPAPGTGWDPVRVAFVGYPAYHKGWLVFENLLDHFGQDPRFEFSHFASKGSRTVRSDAKFVPLEVSLTNRFAAVKILTNADIDIVINPSPWPETFSYVAYESAASGALTYTLNSSGNVAAMVRDGIEGQVFENEEEMLEAFAGGLAISQVQACIREGKKRRNLVTCGTTTALFETENEG